MTPRVFFDTNTLVYMFDTNDLRKQERARHLFESAAAAGTIVLSTQVLQEFFVTVTRKLSPGLPVEAALEVVGELANLPLVQVDPETILKAGKLTTRESVSFWDALIIAAAAAGGGALVYSEDLQDGWKVLGLTVVNPFAHQTAT
jgi:predicted nucleic acid-binding protein